MAQPVMRFWIVDLKNKSNMFSHVSDMIFQFVINILKLLDNLVWHIYIHEYLMVEWEV